MPWSSWKFRVSYTVLTGNASWVAHCPDSSCHRPGQVLTKDSRPVVRSFQGQVGSTSPPELGSCFVELSVHRACDLAVANLEHPDLSGEHFQRWRIHS
jgi:hypothetical protein